MLSLLFEVIMKQKKNSLMTQTTGEKSFTLKPSWRQYAFLYLLSIATIPLAGIGFVIFYFVRKKQNRTQYIITDTKISSVNAKYHRNIDLVNIESIETKQSWIQQKLGIGNILLKTSASEMELEGLEDADRLKAILEKAIQAEIQNQKEKEKTRPAEPAYNPGSMDKMEYLTGLWQQGLISEEDYEKERKHFE